MFHDDSLLFLIVSKKVILIFEMVRLALSHSIFVITGMLAAVCLLFSGSVVAQAIAKAYTADAPLQRGMIVRLNSQDKSKVELLTAQNGDSMEGVVVAANDAPVTLSDIDQSKQQVFVATSGRYYVLVSTENGKIAENDYVTISSLSGIGMRAGTTKGFVVGKAINAYDGSANVSDTTSVSDKNGVSKNVSIGLLEVDININRNPLSVTDSDTIIPGIKALQAGAQSITDEPVSMSRVYIACLVLILSMAVAGSILYAGVKSSILAVGRNPLAKKSVLKNMAQVVAVSITILIFSVGAVYLILKL